MRRILLFLSALAVVAACGGDPVEPAGKPKPDPYLTIRLLNQLDTTAKVGRANWRVYALLSGPYPNQNGISYMGGMAFRDLRFGQNLICMVVASDSIGQRLIAPFAIGDTVHEQMQENVATDSIVARWYAGNHAPAAGYVILTMDPLDAWDSDQYAAGHGLVREDPIKWAWTWTGSGSATFVERTALDTTGCNRA